MISNEPPRIAAVTGASGFIGRRLVASLAGHGWQVRLLLRRDPAIAEWQGLRLQVVAGDLGAAPALERLVQGASVVIHLAGVIKAARESDFFAVNRDGAAALAGCVSSVAPAAQTLLISSISAREPSLSPYAASKCAGEEAMREVLTDRLTIVRPAAVYGPGDKETLRVFKLASGAFVPLIGSSGARVSVIHVDDLVELIAACAQFPQGARVLTATDARREGYSWRELLGAAAHAVGNGRAHFFQAPRWLLHVAALGGDIARGLGVDAMLSHQKLREALHPDWGVREPSPEVGAWAPRFTLEAGFAATVAWYRAVRWLPPAH